MVAAGSGAVTDPVTSRAAGAPAPPGPLGVVFVHGLGSQPRGETLLNWSGPITRAVSTWASTCAGADKHGPTDCVVRTKIAFEGDSVPLVRIEVPGAVIGGRVFEPGTWMMTEAWWAQRVAPPSLATMIDWCGSGGVVAHVVERLIGHLSGGSPGLVTVLSKLGFGLFLSTACTILLLVYAAARAVAAIVPIKQVQDAVARFQLDTLLTKWWGSAYLLLEDPVQSANIRGRLSRSIDALRALGCTRIAVVAHSGGTIVSYMLLSDPAYGDIRADTFITHGEAISMGRRISEPPRLESSVPPRLGRDDASGGRWIDFWATHDPAPCGALSPEFDAPDARSASGVHLARKVWNRRSVMDDHGTYWDNDEEFVYDVISELDRAGTGRDDSRFDVPIPVGADRQRHPVPLEPWRDRRYQRVAMLTLWVRMLFVIPLVAAVGAFVLGRPGMIRGLGEGAYSIGASNGDIKGLADSIGGFVLPWPPAHEAMLAVGLVAIAVLVLTALIHAALPIEQEAVWPENSLRRASYFVLDRAPTLIVGVVVLLAITPFVAWFGGHGLDQRLVSVVAAAFAAIVLIGLLVAAPDMGPLGRIQRLARDHPATRAAGLLIVVMVVIAAIAYALLVDEGVRTWVLGTLVAFVGFQALGRIGRWRWSVWDGRERAAFRDQAFRVPVSQPSRVWPAIQIILLAGSAVLAGVTISLDWAFGAPLTLVVVVVLIFVSVLRDAGLEATPVGGGPAPDRQAMSARVAK